MSVNKVILVGNVGKDPEVRHLDNGVAVANLTLATSDRAYTTSNGVQIPEKTEWHNLVLWRGLADVAEKYVKKGTQIYVEGKIRTRSYDDQAGNKRYITEIYVDVMQLLGKRDSSGEAAAQPVGVSVVSESQPEPFGEKSESDNLPF